MSLRFPISLLVCASALVAQSPGLDLTSVPTRITPESLVAGDFNGDGKPDLAVSGDDSEGNGAVEILLGVGDGTFRSAGVIAVGLPATRIAQADFNGDGKLDLAVSVGRDGQVMILLGNGDGGFRAPIDSGAKTPAGQLSALIAAMAVGDVNGDGLPDLVLGPYTFETSSSIAVMLGKGDGTFQSPVNSSLDRVDKPKIVVADLNGDGRADVFVTGWSPTEKQRYGRLLGNADGSLTLTWSTYTYKFAFGSILTVGDFTGHGKRDVMALDFLDYPFPGRLTFWGFLNGSIHETGSAFDNIPVDSGSGLRFVSMTAGDVNGDGKQDLLVTDQSGSLLIMLGDGLGTFAGPPQYPPASPSPTIYTGANAPYDDYWGSVTTADFRGIGKQDVVMALAGKSVSLLLNGGKPPVVSSLNNAASMAVAPVVPGSLMTVFGSSFAYASGTTQPGAPVAVNGVAETLFGLTIQANGINAPLFYASPEQANVQIPWELAGQSQATLLVTRNGVTRSLTVPVAPYAPGLFSMNQSGHAQAAALIGSTAVVAAPAGAFPGSRPIHAGEYLSLYGTGLGAVRNSQITNQRPECCVPTTTTPVVTVGGMPATVQFSGLAPTLLGVYQVNILIPPDAPHGDAVPVVLKIGGTISNTVTIAIE
jgi:uncharacterized protein (TIGR03437 family)